MTRTLLQKILSILRSTHHHYAANNLPPALLLALLLTLLLHLVNFFYQLIMWNTWYLPSSKSLTQASLSQLQGSSFCYEILNICSMGWRNPDGGIYHCFAPGTVLTYWPSQTNSPSSKCRSRVMASCSVHGSDVHSTTWRPLQSGSFVRRSQFPPSWSFLQPPLQFYGVPSGWLHKYNF